MIGGLLLVIVLLSIVAAMYGLWTQPEPKPVPVVVRVERRR